MTFLNIIEIIGGLILGEGFLELLKGLATRKSVKKAAELENSKVEQELEKERMGTVDEGERLSAQHDKDLEYYRSINAEKDAIIAEKDVEIKELKDQINCLSSSIVQAQMLRCDTIACSSRIPPFGYKKINFRTGEIE